MKVLQVTEKFIDDSYMLPPVAWRWMSQHRVAWICWLWLLSRGTLIILAKPTYDLRRYFEVSGDFLQGLTPYAQFMLEYPPGALVLFSIPHAVTSRISTYTKLFALFMALIDMGIVALLWRMPKLLADSKYHKLEQAKDALVSQGAWSCTLYLLLTSILYKVTLQRFDLVCSFLVIAWLANTISSKRLWLSDLLLALGIWVKLISLLLVPIYLAYIFATTLPEPKLTMPYQNKLYHA